MAHYFSQAHSSLRMFTQRERERERELQCLPMDDLGSALGSGGGLDSGSSGDFIKINWKNPWSLLLPLQWWLVAIFLLARAVLRGKAV